jgi:hypothetical protein
MHRLVRVGGCVIQCITIERLEAGTRGSCKGLDTIYSDIISFIRNDCGVVLQLVQRSLRGQGFDFLANAIFPAITQTIQVCANHMQ